MTPSPAIAPPSSACTAWWRPTPWPANCPSWQPSPATTVRSNCSGVEVRTPSGAQLVDPIDLRLEPGETLVITGAVRRRQDHSAAQPGPAVALHLRAPCADPSTTTTPCSCRRCPTCRWATCARWCPTRRTPGRFPTSDLQRALTKVALSHLAIRLNEVQDWAKVLSPGEQQRIAFARVLLTRPKAVFLDESTSALDEGLEFALYDLVRTELPNTILVSVSHRSTVEQHHDPASGAAGRGCLAARPGRGKRARTGLIRRRTVRVREEHARGDVQAVFGLGERDPAFAAVGGQGAG